MSSVVVENDFHLKMKKLKMKKRKKHRKEKTFSFLFNTSVEESSRFNKNIGRMKKEEKEYDRRRFENEMENYF